MSKVRRRASVAVACAVVAGAGAAFAPPAQANDVAYRFWTYWLGSPAQTWSFATAGPAALVPPDGSVEGWRFAVTQRAGAVDARPRTAASFEQICGSTPAPVGSKRVALVIDPGVPADSPPGQQPAEPTAECVVIDEAATGYQVLRTVATVRVERGLVCGIGGYPTGECAPVVDVAPSATSSPAAVGATGSAPGSQAAAAPESGSSPWPLVAVVAVVGAVVGVLAWRRPRG